MQNCYDRAAGPVPFVHHNQKVGLCSRIHSVERLIQQ
jgi:hypothetical protein